MSWVETTEPRFDVTARREHRRFWSRNERTITDTARIDGVLDHGGGTGKRQSHRHAEQCKQDHEDGGRISCEETHCCAHGAHDDRSETDIAIQRKSLHEVVRSESHDSKQNRRQRRHKSIRRLGEYLLLKKGRSTRNEHPPTGVEEEIE